MAFYEPLGSTSTIQQLGTSQIVDSLSTSLRTATHGVQATLVLPQSWYDAGTAIPRLEVFAQAIDTIMGGGKVSSASASQILDANGLLQDAVTFTVAHPGPGGVPDAFTTDVTVLSSDMGGTGLGYGNVGPQYAEGLIDAAYQQLAAIAASG